MSNRQSASLEPTVVYDPSSQGHSGRDSESTGLASAAVSGAKVGLVVDGKRSLSSETAELLQSRLRASALVLSLGLGVFLLRAVFIAEGRLFSLRTVVLAMALSSYWLLRSKRQLTLRTLRLLELVVLGIVGLQTVALQVDGMRSAAASQEPAWTTSAASFAFMTWIAMIMAYGIFIPNTWQRAARILIPAALIPLAVTAALCLLDEQVARTTDFERVTGASLFTVVATIASIVGTHTVTAVRTEAFKAKQFGQYRLKQRLGGGGMGEVFLAEHQLLKRPSAIKLIRSNQDSDAAALARFELEVQATAKLSHWNTVEIFDYGRTDDGTFYYVMEYLPGMTLAEIVYQHGPMPPERVVHLLRQTCSALREAHHSGLIHRDIKPSNIIAATRGGIWDVAKLLDFGLVMDATDSASSRQRSGQSVSGSPLFMSPEQAMADSDPDARSDIYSVGATAYFLLTGRPPFSGNNPIDLIRAHATQPVAPPSRLASGVPRDLEEVVLRCLGKHAADRFASAKALEEAFVACSCAWRWTEQRAEQWWKDAAAAREGVGHQDGGR